MTEWLNWTEISKIRNEREDTTNTTKDYKRLLYKQLHANKLDNQEEMDTFLKTFNDQLLVMKSNHWSKNSPQNKSPGPDGFKGEVNYTKHLKKT